MKATITLHKHPYEDRYLMCWYNLQVEDLKFSFRADKFVPKELSERLKSLHCIRHTKSSLEKAVSILLKPYIDIIVSSYKEALISEQLVEKSVFGKYSK